jgi:hypothetical protein
MYLSVFNTLNIWWPVPLFLDIYFIYRYNIEVDEEQIYIQYLGWGLLVVLSAGCGLEAWMHWSCID